MIGVDFKKLVRTPVPNYHQDTPRQLPCQCKNKSKCSNAGQLGLKSSRPWVFLSGSTLPESTRPGVFSERSVTYMYMIYGLGSA